MKLFLALFLPCLGETTVVIIIYNTWGIQAFSQLSVQYILLGLFLVMFIPFIRLTWADNDTHNKSN